MAEVDYLKQMKTACEGIAAVKVGDTHELASKLWALGLNYMDDVRARAKRSFFWALIISFTGMLFFFLSLGLMMAGLLSFSKLTLIAGMSIQIISAIGFYLYAKTAKEFFAFHLCIERANRYLLANTICEKLGSNKDEVRAELIRLIAGAPPLSESLVELGSSGPVNIEPVPSALQPSLSPVARN